MSLSVPARSALVALCIVLLAVSGCRSHRAKEAEKVTAASLYKKAHKSLENYDFNGAIKSYEALTARFPFTDEARQARNRALATDFYRREAESQ